MNESSESHKNDLTSETLENIRVGYQAALGLRTSRADELWSQFNAMAVVQSILVAAAVVLATEDEQSISSIAIALLGCLTSGVWLLMHLRGTFWIKHYRDSALHYEEFLDGVDTLISGKKRRSKAGPLTVTAGSIVVIFSFVLAHLMIASEVF